MAWPSGASRMRSDMLIEEHVVWGRERRVGEENGKQEAGCRENGQDED